MSATGEDSSAQDSSQAKPTIFSSNPWTVHIDKASKASSDDQLLMISLGVSLSLVVLRCRETGQGQLLELST